MLAGQTLYLFVVDLTGIRVQAILNSVIDLAGKVWLGSVGQMTTVGQAHTQNRITRLTQGHVDRSISLRTGMGLHIGVGCTEQLLSPIYSQLFCHIHMLTSAVVALTRIALCIFIGQNRALGLHNSRTGVVLRSNQLNMLLLPLLLGLNSRPDLIVITTNLHLFAEHKTLLRREKLAILAGGWRLVCNHILMELAGNLILRQHSGE